MKNKKGVTLIELLAVILILGIIALIAIPTVNNILKEAREGSFKASANNIIKSAEQKCQTQLIKGEIQTLTYVFSNGKLSNELDIKGTMPDNGYIFLNKECSITNYYLVNQDFVYSNGENIIDDYMLKNSTQESTSIFKILYEEYFNNIESVNFVNNLNIPNNAIEINDPSVSKNGKIKSWLIEDNSQYHLYVGSEEKIYANYSSYYLFGDLINMTNINLSNFDTSFVRDFNRMFFNCRLLLEIDVSSFNMSSATKIYYMFYGCELLTSLDVSNWDISNVDNMGGLFEGCIGLKNLNLNDWDTSNAQNMWFLFANCTSLESIDLSSWDFNNVTNTDDIFKNCNNLYRLNILNSNVLNILDDYLPTRSAESIGTIVINGDKTNLDTTTLNSKYWNVA